MMNYIRILWIFISISALIVVPTILLNPIADYICPPYNDGGRECSELVDNITEPFFWSFLYLLPIIFILLFLRREVFIAWVKFAGVAFPIMLGLLFYTFNNEPGTGGWISGANDDAMIASSVLPVLFLIISLLIIVVKSWMLRGK